MDRFYYFIVINSWVVFHAHGNGTLHSITIKHLLRNVALKGVIVHYCLDFDAYVSSSLLETLRSLLNIDQHAIQTVVGGLGFEARSNIAGGD
jgi:hypothetical protein